MRGTKIVKSTTVVRPDSRIRYTVYRVKSRSQARSEAPAVETLGRLQRRLARAQGVFADNYLVRHERSRRKKRNGWIRDEPYNFLRALSKASRKLRGFSLF